MHFNGAKAAYFSQGSELPTSILPNADSRIKDRLTLFEEIFASLSKGYSKNRMLYATTSLFHFLGSMKFIGEYRACNTLSTRGRDVVEEAIHYMQENVNQKLSLTDIAREVKLSISYFSNLFLDKTGYSPLHYLTQLRIKK